MDCDFFSKNPESCKGLGARLKEIENQSGGASGGVPNSCIDFDMGDWTLEDKYYSIDVLPEQHNQGLKPQVSLQELVSGDCYEEVYASIFYKTDGTIKIRVLCLPDCRFEGRLIVDG